LTNEHGAARKKAPAFHHAIYKFIIQQFTRKVNSKRQKNKGLTKRRENDYTDDGTPEFVEIQRVRGAW
jgi:hypothetical protein